MPLHRTRQPIYLDLPRGARRRRARSCTDTGASKRLNLE